MSASGVLRGVLTIRLLRQEIRSLKSVMRPLIAHTCLLPQSDSKWISDSVVKIVKDFDLDLAFMAARCIRWSRVCGIAGDDGSLSVRLRFLWDEFPIALDSNEWIIARSHRTRYILAGIASRYKSFASPPTPLASHSGGPFYPRSSSFTTQYPYSNPCSNEMRGIYQASCQQNNANSIAATSQHHP